MVRKGNLAILKANKNEQISETGVAMYTKIGLHAFHLNLYLLEFFELVLFFDPHRIIIAHGLKGKFGHFEGK